jgi:hypothetical protein
MNCIRVCQYAANLPRPRFDRALECVSGGGARAGHAAAKLTARLEAMQAGGRSPHVNVVSFNLNAHGMGDSCMPMCVVLQFNAPNLFCPYVAVSLFASAERRRDVAITPSHLRIIACAIVSVPCLSPGMIYAASSTTPTARNVISR